MRSESFKNNGLDALMAQAPRHVLSAIQNASAKTGVDFAYLVEKAGTESAFNPSAKAKGSSATGLFQFIEKTWMGMVKDHGGKYGLTSLASKIDEDGRVRDSATRQKILNLRKDPQIASYMAAEYASDNEGFLKKTVEGPIGSTELYLAHFMGAGGASAFLNQKNKNPSAIAADLFPREAMANRNVFYDTGTGRAKTLGQIYSAFDTKFTDDVLKPQNSVRVADNTNNTAPVSLLPATEENDNAFTAYKLSAYRYVLPQQKTDTTATALNDTVQEMLNPYPERAVFPNSLYSRGGLNQTALLLLNSDRYND